MNMQETLNVEARKEETLTASAYETICNLVSIERFQAKSALITSVMLITLRRPTPMSA